MGHAGARPEDAYRRDGARAAPEIRRGDRREQHAGTRLERILRASPNACCAKTKTSARERIRDSRPPPDSCGSSAPPNRSAPWAPASIPSSRLMRADAASSTGSLRAEKSAIRVPSTASSFTRDSGAIPSTPPSKPLFYFCARQGVPITPTPAIAAFPTGSPITPSSAGRAISVPSSKASRPSHRSGAFRRSGGKHAAQGRLGGGDRRIDEGFPRCYTDLSCFTHDAALERYRNRALGTPMIRDRTMFGSDFDVLFFTEPGMTLERYYKRFRDAFGADDLLHMASTVPREFLELC